MESLNALNLHAPIAPALTVKRVATLFQSLQNIDVKQAQYDATVEGWMVEMRRLFCCSLVQEPVFVTELAKKHDWIRERVAEFYDLKSLFQSCGIDESSQACCLAQQLLDKIHGALAENVGAVQLTLDRFNEEQPAGDKHAAVSTKKLYLKIYVADKPVIVEFANLPNKAGIKLIPLRICSQLSGFKFRTGEGNLRTSKGVPVAVPKGPQSNRSSANFSYGVTNSQKIKQFEQEAKRKGQVLLLMDKVRMDDHQQTMRWWEDDIWFALPEGKVNKNQLLEPLRERADYTLHVRDSFSANAMTAA
ncbi:hypothetical protein FNU76_00695 [Chitinimonas arctica]|uniref:Uncharacterized protein n=1 Tax=Chitinimonas arctica TaxID=2594795 RepID=A0A516SA10_9NEIS|nr:hypothetical protein [Chitinimonas arctica]QDQ24982.1 hypothetical protein FNU76_00695 [Chitinimonas arctica]